MVDVVVVEGITVTGGSFATDDSAFCRGGKHKGFTISTSFELTGELMLLTAVTAMREETTEETLVEEGFLSIKGEDEDTTMDEVVVVTLDVDIVVG